MAGVGQGSGTITGDRVRGQVLNGSGGDWLLLRPDGAGQLDVRITIKTDDDALIYMRYEGIESGSMPFAQLHYPVEHTSEFTGTFRRLHRRVRCADARVVFLAARTACCITAATASIYASGISS